MKKMISRPIILDNDNHDDDSVNMNIPVVYLEDVINYEEPKKFPNLKAEDTRQIRRAKARKTNRRKKNASNNNNR